MARVALLAVVFGSSAVLAAPALAGGTAGTPSRAAIVRCFEQRRVLVDPGLADYLPARVVARSRQIALSFVFTPENVVPGVPALVVTSPSPSAGARTQERIVAYVVAHGNAPAAVVRRYVERHRSSVVMWLNDTNAYARRVVAACLGPRTA